MALSPEPLQAGRAALIDFALRSRRSISFTSTLPAGVVFRSLSLSTLLGYLKALKSCVAHPIWLNTHNAHLNVAAC